jgi:SAM-dependent methyltransferase
MTAGALPPKGFTAHNVRLDDGSFTLPDAPPIDQTGDYRCVKNLLPVLFPDGWEGRTIVDLGCLEGGFATEFARLGLDSTGIEIRESNLENAEYIRSRTNLKNLRFIQDDAWNVGKYGPFDLVFCVGLHYHIEDQRRFLKEMGAACRKAILIDTHVAPEFDHEPCVAIGELSELTTHEGLPGRWYPEHDLEVGSDGAELETMRWSSWENKRSFWPTRGALIHAMYGAGFTTVLEDFDQFQGSSVQQLSPDGWHYHNQRVMFVGLKAGAAPGTGWFDSPEHRLDGRLRSAPSTKAPPPEINPLQADLEAARRDAEIARAAAEAGRRQLEAVHASTSWRLTRPLRQLATMVRR